MSAAARRRDVLAGALAACLVAAPVLAAGLGADDMALGSAKAPVTVIEYASLGCPHCAVWAINVFPAFKARFIDTGKVRFVFREMLTGQPTLAAAGFLTARCAAPGKYFDVVDQVFRAQQDMVRDGDAYGPLLRIARSAGLTQDQFDACMKDKAALDALQARSDRNGELGGVTGTPTFVVGERKLAGEQSLDDLAAAIAAAGRR